MQGYSARGVPPLPQCAVWSAAVQQQSLPPLARPASQLPRTAAALLSRRDRGARDKGAMLGNKTRRGHI